MHAFNADIVYPDQMLHLIWFCTVCQLSLCVCGQVAAEVGEGSGSGSGVLDKRTIIVNKLSFHNILVLV